MEECKRKRKQKQFPYSFIPRDRKETIQEGRSTPLNAREAVHRPRTAPKKGGGYLLSRIAAQYHRRGWA